MSRDRLARRVRAEVADVRVRLEEAVLRSDALLATGQPERAAAVLDEQHALLAELQDTIASAVAAASVEAEAEAVIFGAPSAVSWSPHTDDAHLPAAPATAPRRVLATASAVASAVAVLALLFLGAPSPSPTTMAAVDTDDVADDRTDDAAAGGTSAGADATRDLGADDRPMGPDEREIRRLSAGSAPSPEGDDGLDVGTSLSELQALVDQFVASVFRVAGGLADADLPRDPVELGPRPSAPSGDDGIATLPREPEATAPGSSHPTDRPADATERDAAREGSDDDGPSGERSDEDPGLPVPSEDGNAANPGVPPVLE